MAQITLNSTGVASNGALVLQSNGTTTAVTIDTSQRAAFVAGTAALPAITTTGDTNTGIFFPAADTIAFSEGGVEAARIDSSGNFGLGVTPSAWSPGKAVEVGFSGSGVYSYSQTDTELLSNAYYNAGYKYGGTGRAMMYGMGTAGTGIHAWYNAASGTAGDAITFTQAMTLDASGRLGVGQTSPSAKLDILSTSGTTAIFKDSARYALVSIQSSGTNQDTYLDFAPTGTGSAVFQVSSVERARIDSSGNLLVGKTSAAIGTAGAYITALGESVFTVSANPVVYVNRLTDDGDLVRFFQATTQEGSISVSGTTVSYNGGHLSRYAQTTTAKDESLVKGTVLSNLDAMNVYTDAEGNLVDNEQLNKVKVSDVEGDANVAGVFVNWSHDEDHNVDEINMAMTGDMIIRIAQGVTVQRGDLLMSAGNGTAKPQGDDIVRSKTVAKVTSTHVTCTYPDGSFCVPCVLMAC